MSGGGDGDTQNNTATDNTTIVADPDLAITKTAAGSFTQGQVGAAYTLTVTNTGGAATSGTVTVIDNLPAGLTPTAVSGSGRPAASPEARPPALAADPLGPGAAYPPITLTVGVGHCPGIGTNMATAGGGGDLNSANNSVTLVTAISGDPT